MTFDDFSAGSSSTNEHPGFESGNEQGGSVVNGKDDVNSDNNPDGGVKLLLKPLGGTLNDIKRFQVDSDLPKL